MDTKYDEMNIGGLRLTSKRLLKIYQKNTRENIKIELIGIIWWELHCNILQTETRTKLEKVSY